MSGGKSESNANLAEGLATALVCFDDMNEIREEHRFGVQNHCVLVCNSTPYSMPVLECNEYENKSIEQLAAIFQEVCLSKDVYHGKNMNLKKKNKNIFLIFQKNVNLSIISPRKIPILIKIFEKASGDLSSLNQEFSKDPRHLVLLKGYSFNDRPSTPQTNTPTAAPVTTNQNTTNANLQSPNNQPIQKDVVINPNQNNQPRPNSMLRFYKILKFLLYLYHVMIA